MNLKNCTTEDLLDLMHLIAARTVDDMRRHNLHGVKTSNRRHMSEFIEQAKDNMLDQGLATLNEIGAELRSRQFTTPPTGK